ncbi:MAG: aromatic-ring-hydroxylating dioxygenase subunit beta [Alphaproteobacteria bacterium]
MRLRIADELLGADSLDSLTAVQLRLLVDELLSDYAACLDNGEIDRWPDFFTDDCTYKVIARDNHERGRPLATILCESRGYLLDRVRAVQETSYYLPRQLRHVVSGLRITGHDGDEIRAEANYAVFRTMPDEETRVFNVGNYMDSIVLDGTRLKFKTKICIYDSILIPNSLVYPI